MNFVQKKRKSDAANKDIVDLQLMRGALMQPVSRVTPSTHSVRSASEFNDDGSMSSLATIATRATTAVLNRHSTAYVAITSGRGHAQSEVGIAWIDIESPSIKLIQMSDDHWYTGLLNKLNIIQPAQIIVPHTIYDAKPEMADGKLMKYLREQFPLFDVIKIPRRNFTDIDGTAFINKYCSPKFHHIMQSITSKYYALSALAGLVRYLLYSAHVHFRENSLKLEFDTKYGHLLMDVETTYTLELLSGGGRKRMKRVQMSLYDVLDRCVTSIGKRTLRARILEPSCDVPYIKMHQQCIAELNAKQHVELKGVLAGILKQFNYVERLHKLTLVVPQDDNIRAAEVLINQTIQLRTCLQLVPVLRIKLETLHSPIVRDIFNALSDERYRLMLETIDTVLNKELIALRNDSTTQMMQRIHCIQSGKCDIVDMLRNIYNELIEELQNYVINLSSKYGQAFKMRYDAAHGYHARLMIAADTTANDFPPEFEVLSLKRKLCILTTSDIKKLNIRLKSVIEEITINSNVVLAFMLTDIVTEIDAIYDLSGFIASLDNLISMAMISNRDDYVCPTFTEEIRIVNAVHPLLEGNVRDEKAQPNNVIATPDYNFFIITGPNMSGKTVYLKMIAVLQIMAQLGCYIPAAQAELRVTDRIFTRIGSNDSIEKNASSFVLEVNMTEHILKNVTANSLVIIDELYRSTNPKEGLQLAWSFCERLISKHGKAMAGEFFEESVFTKGNDDQSAVTRTSVMTSNTKVCEVTAPYIYLTTHYHNLTRLADWYFNVVNLSFNAEEVRDENGQIHLNYSHSIQEGCCSVESYGLKLAESVRFPPSIVPKAKLIYRDLKIRDECENVNIQRNGQRKCSEFAKRLTSTHTDRLNVAQSVVSTVMAGNGDRNSSTSVRKPTKSTNSKLSITTSNRSDVDDASYRIDKVLYNLYGDIASALRKCEINAKKQKSPTKFASDSSCCSRSINSSAATTNNETPNPQDSEERQTEAMMECLKAFVGEHTNDELIAAIVDGLQERPVELITLPNESQSSASNGIIDADEQQTIANNRIRDNEPSQPFTEFVVPPPVWTNVSGSSQYSFRTTRTKYETPHNSPFEFDMNSQRSTPATLPDNNNWSQLSDGRTLTHSITQRQQHSNGRDDQFNFVSPMPNANTPFETFSASGSQFDRSQHRRRQHTPHNSLFNISTQFNPHLTFDTDFDNRNSGATATAPKDDIGNDDYDYEYDDDDYDDGDDYGSDTHSNNSENKYAKPFKSIQSDSKVCKSNSKHDHNRIVNRRVTPAAAAATTNQKQQHRPQRTSIGSTSIVSFGPEPKTQTATSRVAQAKQRNGKPFKNDKFKLQMTEFYRSEQYQRFHRQIKDPPRTASSTVVKSMPPTKHVQLTEHASPSIVLSATENNEETAAVTATNNTNDDDVDDADSAIPDSLILPPPPGF